MSPGGKHQEASGLYICRDKVGTGGPFHCCKGKLRAADDSFSFPAPSTTLAARLGPPPQPPSTEVPITGRNRRSGDRAFFQGCIACMARNPRSIFALDEAIAVVNSARALLLELLEERLLSVWAAWRLGREDSWEGQRLSEVVVGLVTTLRAAHDHCSTVVFWPTPEQDRDDQGRRALATGRDNYSGGRDVSGGAGRDRHGGAGGGGGGSGGGHCHGGSSRRSGGGGTSSCQESEIYISGSP